MMRLLFITVLALGLTASTVGTLAHHDWSWTTGDNIDLPASSRPSAWAIPTAF